MRLRVAKNIAFARSCGPTCGHRWSTMDKAVAVVARAVRRGRIDKEALRYWSDQDRTLAGLPIFEPPP